MKKLVLFTLLFLPFNLLSQVATLNYKYIGELSNVGTIDMPILISKEFTPVQIHIYESSVTIVHGTELLCAIKNTHFNERYSIALKRNLYVLSNGSTSLLMDKAVDNVFLIFSDGTKYLFTNN